MKRSLIYCILIFCNSLLFAQTECYEPDASIWVDTWVSCERSPNPKSEYDNAHWIQYDFGSDHTLAQTWVWNTNDPARLNQGFNLVKVDHSLDGQTWDYWGELNFPKGEGTAVYSGFAGPDLSGITARYVLLTVMSNHGDPSCSGIAEIKFNLSAPSFTPDFNEDDDDDDDGDEDCLAIEEYFIEEITPTEAFIIWEWEGEEEMEFVFQYRVLGEDEILEITTDEPEIFLEDLLPNTTYEFRIEIECEDETLFSDTWTFQTTEESDCAVVEEIWLEPISETEVLITWESEQDWFFIELFTEEEEEPLEFEVEEPELYLEDLTPFTEYELIIGIECGEDLAFSEPLFFFTDGETTSITSLSEELTYNQQLINLFPNPTAGQLVVEYQSSTQDVLNYNLTDIAGKIVLQQVFNLQKGKNLIDVNVYSLPDGVYFLNTLTQKGKRIISKKIVKSQP